MRSADWGWPISSSARSSAGQAAAPDTSVILFWMWGGPSQLETWDMKPDAPSEYRGPFSPIQTSVPGIEICELFPLLAGQAKRYSLVRSLHHDMAAHNDGSIELLTGKTPTKADPTSTAKSEHPDFGMITSRLRGGHAAWSAKVCRHPPPAVHDAARVSRDEPSGLCCR